MSSTSAISSIERPGEISHLHDLVGTSVDPCQLLKCSVQRLHFWRGQLRFRVVARQGDVNVAPTALLSAAFAYIVDDDAAHDARSIGVEHASVAAGDFRLTNQTEIGLVHQARRIQIGKRRFAR